MEHLEQQEMYVTVILQFSFFLLLLYMEIDNFAYQNLVFLGSDPVHSETCQIPVNGASLKMEARHPSWQMTRRQGRQHTSCAAAS